MTLVNGSQLQTPIVPSVASATQVHQFWAVASRHSESTGSPTPPSPASPPIGRHAVPLAIPDMQSGVSALTVVAVGPACRMVNSISSGAPGLTP